jgi:GMP synthase (glutamine-hydrolysing)
MHIHILQHVPFEDEGAIRGWASGKGATLSRTRLFAGDPLPQSDRYDWLIVMGGPMGVSDHYYYPWLRDEKATIGRAIEEGKTVLGICLGAQLIAQVLGAKVYKNSHREIGWFPLELTEAGSESALFRGIPRRFTAFHWHGDAFEIPAGATHLAQTIACGNQAFSLEERVVGLQFHLESTGQSVENLLHNCRSEIEPGPWMQQPEEIQGKEGVLEHLAGIGLSFLDNMHDRHGKRRQCNPES